MPDLNPAEPVGDKGELPSDPEVYLESDATRAVGTFRGCPFGARTLDTDDGFCVGVAGVTRKPTRQSSEQKNSAEALTKEISETEIAVKKSCTS